MIDQWSCRRAEKLGEPIDNNYTSEQAVQGVYLRNETAPNLAVVFPPWHGGGVALKILKKRLSKSGHAVLSFNLHDQILEPSVERVVASFDHMKSASVTAANELISRNDYKHVSLFSLSLGAVALARATSALKFDSASMVVGSSNLALSMWEGNRTQMIKRALESQGVTADELDERWQTLAPKNYAGYFEGREVTMFISDADNIVPTRYQQEFADHLAAAGAKLTTVHSMLGHYSAAAHFCLKAIF